MGELVRSNRGKSTARLRLVRRPLTLDGYGEQDRYDAGCLISFPDTAISRRLQEQTRIVLAMLTPRERLVLRLRFGIPQTGAHPLEMIDGVLTPVQMACIEATALRKLRHPSQIARLRSVDKG